MFKSAGRSAAKALGESAEQRALDHLLAHGLQLVQRNYRLAFGPHARGGEVDLILRERDGTLRFRRGARAAQRGLRRRRGERRCGQAGAAGARGAALPAATAHAAAVPLRRGRDRWRPVATGTAARSRRKGLTYDRGPCSNSASSSSSSTALTFTTRPPRPLPDRSPTRHSTLVGCITAGGKLLRRRQRRARPRWRSTFSAAFVDRFERERPGLAALALGADGAVLGALAASGGVEQVVARQVQALGQPGDVLLICDAPGDSGTLLAAVGAAHAKDMSVVVLAGRQADALRQALRRNRRNSSPCRTNARARAGNAPAGAALPVRRGRSATDGRTGHHMIHPQHIHCRHACRRHAGSRHSLRSPRSAAASRWPAARWSARR